MRNSIIIPTIDAEGNVVCFDYYIIDKAQLYKYPNSDKFARSNHLYSFNLAVRSEKKSVIIVSSYEDYFKLFGLGMATVNFIPESNQSISAMKAVIDYCLQQKKVADEDSGRRLVSGVNCNGENSFTEFMVTKNAHKKKGGITFYHYVQSFSPRENVSAEQVHKIGLEFAEKAWPGHEVLVTTHTDAEHLHNHFVINSVHYENGSKLRQNPGTLTRLRTLSDSICNEHGLSVLKPYKKDGAKISSREYRAAAKGESWKFRLMADINSAMNKSGSKQDFISEMQKRGYEITWTDERKYITFTCPNDKKYLRRSARRTTKTEQSHTKVRRPYRKIRPAKDSFPRPATHLRKHPHQSGCASAERVGLPWSLRPCDNGKYLCSP